MKEMTDTVKKYCMFRIQQPSTTAMCQEEIEQIRQRMEICRSCNDTQ